MRSPDSSWPISWRWMRVERGWWPRIVSRDMRTRTLRGQVAVVGIGETRYYKHGQSPDSEFKLALQAILRACDDAGLDPRRIDGFASYSNDRNEPSRLAAAQIGRASCRERV